MKKITHLELIDKILTDVVSPTFVSIKSITVQGELNKGGRKGVPNMFEAININPDTIKKHSKIVGLVSSDSVNYQDFVNNRLTKEAKEAGKDKPQLKFESGSRKWGTKYKESNSIVEHKGGYYLVLYCVANNKPKVEHFYNGTPLDIKDPKFDDWRKPEKSDGENQGTKNPIVVRDYSFNNIKEISLLGETYEVIPD